MQLTFHPIRFPNRHTPFNHRFPPPDKIPWNSFIHIHWISPEFSLNRRWKHTWNKVCPLDSLPGTNTPCWRRPLLTPKPTAYPPGHKLGNFLHFAFHSRLIVFTGLIVYIQCRAHSRSPIRELHADFTCFWPLESIPCSFACRESRRSAVFGVPAPVLSWDGPSTQWPAADAMARETIPSAFVAGKPRWRMRGACVHIAAPRHQTFHECRKTRLGAIATKGAFI